MHLNNHSQDTRWVSKVNHVRQCWSIWIPNTSIDVSKKGSLVTESCILWKFKVIFVASTILKIAIQKYCLDLFGRNMCLLLLPSIKKRKSKKHCPYFRWKSRGETLDCPAARYSISAWWPRRWHWQVLVFVFLDRSQTKSWLFRFTYQKHLKVSKSGQATWDYRQKFFFTSWWIFFCRKPFDISNLGLQMT